MPCIAVGNDEEEAKEQPKKVTFEEELHHNEQAEDEDEEDEDNEEGSDDDKVFVAMPALPSPAPPTRRIVFLDVDGVLNSRQDARQILVEGGPCALLRRLLEASGAELVLSTPWRRNREYVAQVLFNFGVFGHKNDKPPALECTPPHGDGDRKDLEMLHWLQPKRGTILEWVALDSTDLLKWPSVARLEGHTVRVDQGRGGGLGPADIEAALKALGCSSPSSFFSALPQSVPAVSSSSPAGFRPPDQIAPRLSPTQATAGGDVAAQFKAAFNWDEELSTKMEDVLSALSSASGQPRTRPIVAKIQTAAVSPKATSTAAVDAGLAARMDQLLGCLQDEDAVAAAAMAQQFVVQSTHAHSKAAATGAKEFDSTTENLRHRFQQ